MGAPNTIDGSWDSDAPRAHRSRTWASWSWAQFSVLWVTEICFGHPQNVGNQIPGFFFFFLAFLQDISRAHYIDMEFRAEYGDNLDILNLRI